MMRLINRLSTVLICALCLCFTGNGEEGWNTEYVNDGWASSHEVDDLGRVHVAFDQDQTLWYACRTNGSWTFEKICQPVTKFISLTLDKQNNPHISFFYTAPNYDVGYAYRSGTAQWTTEIVDSHGRVGYWNSIAFDPSDELYITYYKDLPVNQQGLKIARRDGVNLWHHEYIDTEIGAGAFSSLVFDNTGRAHVSYKRYNTSNQGLNYATRGSSGLNWSIDFVKSGHIFETSLALDSQNKPHISYCLSPLANNDEDLMHAYQDSLGNWVNELVDAEGDTGGYSSIILDSQDNIHISYSRMTDFNLKYAFYHKGLGKWFTQTESVMDSMIAFTSIALTPDETAVITFTNFDEKNIKPPKLHCSKQVKGMSIDTHLMSCQQGGVFNFHLHGGNGIKDRGYLILGSLTGTAPGTLLPNGLQIPINWDLFTNLVIEFANTPVLWNFYAYLDGAGNSLAHCDTLGALPPELIGMTMHFAFIDEYLEFASNPVSINFKN